MKVPEFGSHLWTLEEHKELRRLARKEQRKEDQCKYLPSLKEIEDRKRNLKWMQRKGLGGRIIEFIMFKDYPPMSVVKRYVRHYGPKGAKIKLRILIHEYTIRTKHR